MITKYTEYIKENSNIIDPYFFQTYEETKKWLDDMYIRNYTINKDLTINTVDNVIIKNRNLTKIPVQFNSINGYFECNRNKLTSLKGCPKFINEGFLDCSNNKLKNLKYIPIYLRYGIYCYKNPLEDINDLDSKILIKNINDIDVSQEVYDKYFEFWINKDINILEILKDKISDKIKTKYDYLFNANNFDLI